MSLSNTSIRTIIIPAAGKGTRMLPATQVTAKELLPVYDRPVIAFAIDEAIDAGAERIIVVINEAKAAIREFLGDTADASNQMAGRTRGAGSSPEIIYVAQEEALGLGHAILCCRGLAFPGPFGVILPDDVIMGRSCLSEMARNYQAGHMIAAMNVPQQDTDMYGIFSLRGSATDVCIPVTGIVEKPPQGQAPSSLAAVGRYLLLPMIFDVLGHTANGAGGELQLTDAIALATRSVPLTAFQFSGTRFDCGSHDGLLAASNARQATLRAGRIKPTQSIARPLPRPERNGKIHSADGADLFCEPARHTS